MTTPAGVLQQHAVARVRPQHEEGSVTKLRKCRKRDRNEVLPDTALLPGLIPVGCRGGKHLGDAEGVVPDGCFQDLELEVQPTTLEDEVKSDKGGAFSWPGSVRCRWNDRAMGQDQRSLIAVV